MKRTKTAAVTGAAMVLALSTAAPAFASYTPSLSVEDLIPALALPQGAADRAPAELDLVALGDIDADSVRSLGSDDAGEYWVGRSGGSEVCLITRLAVDTDVAASSCAPITNFYRQGLSLITAVDREDPTLAAEAYLLPSDVSLNGGSAGAEMRSSGQETSFVSGRPDRLTNLERFELQREDGSVFRFAPLPLVGGQR